MAASKDQVGDNKMSKLSVGKDRSATKVSKKVNPEEEETISIDLTNPEDLLNKLEQLDLDDDEADELLKRAYEVNRELKKQLELGRKVMDKKLSVSPKRSAIAQQRRPGSNRISVDSIPGQTGTRQQSRMASATHSAGPRKSPAKVSELGRSVQNYSYHAYVSSHILNE